MEKLIKPNTIITSASLTGKSTIEKKLQDEFNLPGISTDNILSEESKDPIITEIFNAINLANDKIDSNIKFFNEFNKFEKGTNEISNKLSNDAYDFYMLIPNNLDIFNRSKINNKEYCKKLRDKKESIDNNIKVLVANRTKLVKILNKSKEDTSKILNNLIEKTLLYLGDDKKINKETSNLVNTLRKQLISDKENLSILEDDNNSKLKDIKYVHIPNFFMDFLKPENINTKKDGQYLPDKIKTLQELRITYNDVDVIRESRDLVEKFRNTIDTCLKECRQKDIKHLKPSALLAEKLAKVSLEYESTKEKLKKSKDEVNILLAKSYKFKNSLIKESNLILKSSNKKDISNEYKNLISSNSVLINDIEMKQKNLQKVCDKLDLLHYYTKNNFTEMIQKFKNSEKIADKHPKKELSRVM